MVFMEKYELKLKSDRKWLNSGSGPPVPKGVQEIFPGISGTVELEVGTVNWLTG